MIVLDRSDQLDLELYRRIVVGHEPVALGAAALAAVDGARERLLAHLDTGVSAYGVNTGLGYLAGTHLDAEAQRTFQRALLLRGAGVGPPLAPDVVRGAMLLRLTGFLAGAAGVSAALCEYLAARLNDGWTPVVPARGLTSAGEVIALSHLFQTLVGEGLVTEDGAQVPAAEALARRGVAPYEPGAKEGIALVNGAPIAPALTAWLSARAHAALDHATLAGALAAALSGASLRPYSRRVGALKGDAGQQRVHAALLALHAGAADWSDRPQSPVSLRVVPQVHGAALDVLDHVDAQVARELRAVTDSPLYLEADGEEPAGLYPSGNFHAQALSFGLDALAIAFAQVGNLGERRLHRQLYHRFSGLPDQLAFDPGRQTGLSFLHKSVTGYCAENRMLAAPASVHPAEGSAGQEDFQALTFPAAEKLERILENVELIVAAELLAAAQARELRGAPLPPRLEAVVERLDVPPVTEDRSFTGDLERLHAVVRSGALLTG
ncbi:MAG TPA: aromatic amino acid lyase [Solirubrobacteraceae bacterium]|nr:aromatic amino acid lyase [Solirubrobacteraceae bacterium]